MFQFRFVLHQPGAPSSGPVSSIYMNPIGKNKIMEKQVKGRRHNSRLIVTEATHGSKSVSCPPSGQTKTNIRSGGNFFPLPFFFFNPGYTDCIEGNIKGKKHGKIVPVSPVELTRAVNRKQLYVGVALSSTYI